MSMETACFGNIWAPYHKLERPKHKASPARQCASHYGPCRRRMSTRGTSDQSIRALGVSSNGVTSSPTHDAASPAAASQSVDPQLVSLLQQVANGSMQAETAARHLRELGAGYQQVRDFAQVDTWRAARTGFPEVIWGPGKSADQIAAIMSRLAETEAAVIVTRVTPEVYHKVHAILPDVHYSALAKVLSLKTPVKRKQERLPVLAGKGSVQAIVCLPGSAAFSDPQDMLCTVAVLSAGTADESVAEECRVIADFMGCYTFKLPDVSVDGLHRILHNLPAVRAADVIVVVSGTDGALPSVVAGLVDTPVVAVPTSVGYGAALQSITPLLSALVSSSPGVSVVNIDNGFGAAMVAARILRTASKLRRIALAAQR